MTRKEKIERLVELINDWDVDSLVDYAKTARQEYLETLAEKDLNEEYVSYFDVIKENKSEEIKTEEVSIACSCSLDQIMKSGCACGGS